MTTVRFAVVAILLLVPLAAQAQDPPAGRRPRVIQLERQDVFGRLQQPGASLVFTRGHVDHSGAALRTSFVREIVRQAPR